MSEAKPRLKVVAIHYESPGGYSYTATTLEPLADDTGEAVQIEIRDPLGSYASITLPMGELAPFLAALRDYEYESGSGVGL